ncbi:MAG: hypothetical protein PF693_20780 [Spirochaetia bacterium]|nr:hypothetical protein [Spirochaetia bacterium]
MRKIIILTITLVFSSFYIFAGNVFENISDSNNWTNEHPALLAVDEHNNSFAQIQSDHESAWIELLLDEHSQIVGYQVDAYIPEGSWLSIAYDDGGLRKRIPASYITSNDGIKTVFFQSEHIVSNSVTLYIDGIRASEVKIYDFELIFASANDISINAKLTLSEQADNISDYFDPNFLIDGLASTAWWAFKTSRGGFPGFSIGGFPEQFSFDQDDIKFNKESLLNGRYSNRSQIQSFVEFEVDIPGRYDSFSYYVDDFAWGTVDIKVLTGEGYLEIGSTDMMESKGWHHISLNDIDSDISRIRIELSGFHTVLGGLGEIELRGLESADPYRWYQLTGFNDEAGAVYSLFEIENEEIKDHELIVLIDSNESIADLPVTVNGRKLFNYSHEISGSINIFRLKLDSNILWEGNNFISIEADENSRVLGSAIREVIVDSELTISELLIGYDKFIELPNSYDIHQIIVVSDSDSSFDVSLSGENGDTYLEPSEVSGKIAKYTLSSPLETEHVKIYGEDGQYSISVKGNSSGTGTYLRISPEKDYTLNRGGRFLHGISDALYSDTIKINDKRANKLGNYFWIPISRLGINRACPII